MNITHTNVTAAMGHVRKSILAIQPMIGGNYKAKDEHNIIKLREIEDQLQDIHMELLTMRPAKRLRRM